MVIVGTDFSSVSARALMKARALAGRLGDELEIVHVRHASPIVDLWVPAEDELAWLRTADTAPESITILSGTPWVELARFAEEKRADIIVVGTHGSRGYHTLSVGTTATRLALLSPCLTLLVGQHL